MNYLIFLVFYYHCNKVIDNIVNINLIDNKSKFKEINIFYKL